MRIVNYQLVSPEYGCKEESHHNMFPKESSSKFTTDPHPTITTALSFTTSLNFAVLKPSHTVVTMKALHRN